MNDPFVVSAWAKHLGANQEDVGFISDFNGSFTKELGLDVDLSVANLGVRSKRYSTMILCASLSLIHLIRFSALIDNGKVVKQFVEVSPGE